MVFIKKRGEGWGLWLSDLFYKNRHSPWPWATLVFVSFLLGFGYTRFITVNPLFSTAFTTAASVLLAVPYLWYIWLIRNRDKHQEIIDKHEDQRLDARRLWTEQLNKAVEWATDPSNRSRQAAAILSLRGYVSEERCQLPAELRGDHNPFRHIVEGVIVSVSQETGEMLQKLKLEGEKQEQQTPTVEERQIRQCRMAIATLVQEPWEGGKAKNLPQANFAFMTFFRANLRGADLQLAHLEEANLPGADLQGAQLQEAQLQEAQLQEAQLQGADLREAQLQGADLRDAQLQGADLRDAQLQGADLRKANLQGANLHMANLEGADLQWADLQWADLHGAYLQNTRGLTWDQLKQAQYFDADSIPPYLQEEIRSTELNKKEFEITKIEMQNWEKEQEEREERKKRSLK